MNCTSGSKSVSPTFTIGGSGIENVDQWPHLGHIISTNFNDQADILHRRNCFIGQVNNVLCTFGKLDSYIMNRLFKVYCSSFYGCELWDLDNKYLTDLCIAWRKGLRRVWRLPNTTKGDMLAVISDSIPVYDELCRRFLNFVFSCMNCGSELVEFFVRFGVHQACMKSPLGRNARFCAIRFGLSVSDIGRCRLNRTCFADKFTSQLPAGFMDRVCFAYEVIAIREGQLTMMNHDFSREEVDDIIA